MGKFLYVANLQHTHTHLFYSLAATDNPALVSYNVRVIQWRARGVNTLYTNQPIGVQHEMKQWSAQLCYLLVLLI